MTFGDQGFAFGSPAAAVAGMIERLGDPAQRRRAIRSPLDDARGMILAEAVLADRDSPAFDHSAMDGYAARLADLGPTARGVDLVLTVAGESRIGSPAPQMPEAPCAVRISTGAPLPAGPRPPDAILKREDVRELRASPGAGDIDADRVASIGIPESTRAAVHAGLNIRRRGENLGAGCVVSARGTLLNAASIGALAAVGEARPKVFPRLRVAVITSGDELVRPEATPLPFQIRDSNGPALAAALAAHPWIEVLPRTHVQDRAEDVLGALAAALGAADAIILSGGVSMGHRDPVRSAVDRLGGRLVFHGLPQRPGKPMLAAIVAAPNLSPEARRGVPVFGLPGNPVSALVTCTRIVMPVLGHVAGVARWPGPSLVAISEPDGRSLDLWWHRLARLAGPGRIELVESRGSGDLVATAASDGFVELPPGCKPGFPADAPSHVAFYGWPT